jgi:hypothetical protein
MEQKELDKIKAEQFNKGWRYGLLATTVFALFWIIVFIMVL